MQFLFAGPQQAVTLLQRLEFAGDLGLTFFDLCLTGLQLLNTNSLLLVFPDGKTMLMDGGGIPLFGRAQRSNLDIGEDVVAPYLWDRGVRRVEKPTVAAEDAAVFDEPSTRQAAES